ncbi:NADH-quinone oxidoreductase subunit L [Nocardioides pocheonensis]|uniref:NADH-quinone oxidoreductase subunit L n=1 Tax=Nocardioides pocheonensis TaxID=661485 RepID=A0A3N0GWX6_9ACTN|nr:NADH-quinone oxidoreductase subunit L [Nocardioides pocheonensis]RNM16658.1 NADH-quinone oxidoreductase subunit L [Nocardioides pocheonensis]
MSLVPSSLAALHSGAPVVHAASADGVFSLLWLVVALPALGAAVLLLGGRRTDRWGHWLGVGTVAVSFLLSLVLFFALVGRDSGDRQVSQHLWTWFTAGKYTVNLDLLYDQLSAVFLLLITGVGGIIHLYSVGYMEHDERRRRFFGYLNLFVASMLTLVLAADYVGVFLGWEGVGLASYLLIGFWQYKPSAAAAAKKAFVINRVGDIGLSLGSALIFVTFGSTSFAVVSANADKASSGTLTAIGLLLLLAACGKSAQFPLQTWLLDAMEGPTPVSALIHAATMVTAGVYLIVRSNFIFSLTEDARTGVVIVGCITLLMGAIIGCAKDDIKKALAGSTMSQIGYMILAAGLGPAGYALAIFHLLTHGFFKANMFLGAGSVMHGTNDDVNMRHYGALQKAMPVTFVTFAIGYLAIIGVPPFAGFWSKDRIIETAFADNFVVGLCALVGAGITAFYMTRLMLMTFVTEQRWEPDVHPHESPRVMTIPLIALAALSALGGFLILNGWITDWLAPVVGTHEEKSLAIGALGMSLVTLVVVAIGIAIAWTFFGRRAVPREAPTQVSVFTRAARAELYGDAFNEEVIVKPGYTGIRGLSVFDGSFVDGIAEGTASAFGGMSSWFRLAQNGFVRSYALAVLSGAALVLLALLAVNFS